MRLERLRRADQQVLAHDTAWLPASVAEPLLDVDFTHTSLYDELSDRCGVRPTAGTEWIGTELPDTAERAHLGIGAKQPVFRIHRLSTSGATPLEWRETVIRADRYTFVAQWSPTEGYGTVLAAEEWPRP